MFYYNKNEKDSFKKEEPILGLMVLVGIEDLGIYIPRGYVSLEKLAQARGIEAAAHCRQDGLVLWCLAANRPLGAAPKDSRIGRKMYGAPADDWGPSFNKNSSNLVALPRREGGRHGQYIDKTGRG